MKLMLILMLVFVVGLNVEAKPRKATRRGKRDEFNFCRQIRDNVNELKNLQETDAQQLKNGFTTIEEQLAHCSGHHEQNRVRLVNGANDKSGRLEVRINGQWGTVCDDNYATGAGTMKNNNAAIVVCRSLGFSGGVVYNQASLGGSAHTDVPTHMDNVNCDGSETSIFDCARRADGEDCYHGEDVGVSCD